MIDTAGYTRVTLEPVPVRYGGDTPSLRRGSVRVNPVRDGVVDPERDTVHLKTRDWSGNKYRDSIDPTTGWCVGASSVLTSAPNNSGDSATWKPAVSGTVTRDTVVAELKCESGVWLGQLDGRRAVVRTTAYGDFLLPSVPPGNAPQPSRKPVTRTPRPVSRPTLPPITRADCVAVIEMMAAVNRRRVPVITDDMIREARKYLRKQRAVQAGKIKTR